MNPSFRCAALGLAVLLAPIASAESYKVDPSHTSVVFSISHLGFSYTYGAFKTNAGSFEFTPDNPATCSFEFTVDAASLDSFDAKRDEHLRGPDFFDVKQFPEITFKSTSVTSEVGEDGKTVYNVTGDLTIHGVTKSVTLPMKLLGEGDSPFGDHRVGFVCSTSVDRTEFGMDFMAGPIGKQVAIVMSFEGVRQ
jgi:polyisoprenoid-binding protein YceI